MKNVTMFYGPQSGGKTYSAKERCKGRKAVWLNPIDFFGPFIYSIKADTELIVMDEFPLHKVWHLCKISKNELLNVNQQAAESFAIAMPEFIVTTNMPISDGFKTYWESEVEFIECNYKP